jgi:hypothetical protein
MLKGINIGGDNRLEYLNFLKKKQDENAELLEKIYMNEDKKNKNEKNSDNPSENNLIDENQNIKNNAALINNNNNKNEEIFDNRDDNIQEQNDTQYDNVLFNCLKNSTKKMSLSKKSQTFMISMSNYCNFVLWK